MTNGALLLVADFQQCFELRLLGVGQRDQRRRVENERHSPKPRISSFSGIEINDARDAATALEPLARSAAATPARAR
jgi:hypothetical protein